MPWYFIEPAAWNADEALLSPGEARHLIRVLRARPGDRVRVFNGRGDVAEAELVATAKDEARVRMLGNSRRHIPRAPVALTLFQSIPKHSLLDWIIQKATELGAAAIVPVRAARAIAGGAERDATQKTDRRRKIALAAAKQCGAAWLPEIAPVVSFREALNRARQCAACFAAVPPRRPATGQPRRSATEQVAPLPQTGVAPWPPTGHQNAQPFKAAVAQVKLRGARSIGLVIGPEGDFTADEIAALKQSGCLPVSFGPLILRVETAALYGLSVLAYEFGLESGFADDGRPA